jgi:hypothetical protein
MTAFTRTQVLTVSTAAVAASAPVLVVAGVPQPAQALLALALLAFLPGFALLRLAAERDPFQVVALSVAVSLSLAAVLATTLLYVGMWSWQTCAFLLAGVTVTACVLQLRRSSS